MERIINRFKKLIDKAQVIVISTHIHPDADGIGSQVALCHALREIGKDIICVNEEPLMERYKYLDPAHTITSYNEYIKNKTHKVIDLFIIVDTSAINRIGKKMQNIEENSKRFLIIDHHPCPKEVAAIHCIDTSMAATGELMGTLIQSIGVKFTQEMALALYTAILIDTSSFRYPTVTGHTHKLVGKLLDIGVKPPHAYNMIYGTKKLSHMQLLGRILSSAHSTQNGEVAWLTLSDTLIKEYGVDHEDTHAFVNHLLILDNVKVACMFREIDNHIKVSFRSAGQIDVGIMAVALGGGGHNHSAATIIEGKLEEVISETIESLELMLEDL